jgi:hypothetical protein
MLGRDRATPEIPYCPFSTVETGRIAFSERINASTMRAPESPIA